MTPPRWVFKGHSFYNRVVHGVANRYEKLREIVHLRKPKVLLEIGVWRGDRAVSLIEAALKAHAPTEIQYFGFDLFEAMHDELARDEVSRPPPNPTRAEVEARLAVFASQGVRVTLVAGNTKEALPNAGLPEIDFAFIDGGHSYDTVKSDWRCVSSLLASDGAAVFDDFVNEEAVVREGFGVNRLLDEIDRSEFHVMLLPPQDWWPRHWGIFKNRLALITRLAR